MSRIEILHPHARRPEDVRRLVADIAAKLQERYGVASTADGDDAIRLSGTGIQGRIRMQPGQVQVVAELGLLFSAMKDLVEDEIRRVLREKLG
ncbi:polyhydroxyalkanoic acid synthase [Pseudoxanthomonas broegbernensis]|uniref:Polyhydroxyalkanoic acid synthase n=1 Tax=Pseudoxanthomonas broegbernensis TaxID=83619 RepID=A0A7V8GQ32_9GAMM|nr:polyhydroxyalkanoic acid system family protein [Pseudoxanthomonas broegbernensis]KAF1687999.1 polyhydroxyalkanoic acid synthase [Pseudoxanthomonas broegbernensis]MBB6065016.1 putative polyhydroxyalkanoate system protein [Pseudoxanthomonas broegbernensis]